MLLTSSKAQGHSCLINSQRWSQDTHSFTFQDNMVSYLVLSALSQDVSPPIGSSID